MKIHEFFFLLELRFVVHKENAETFNARNEQYRNCPESYEGLKHIFKIFKIICRPV